MSERVIQKIEERMAQKGIDLNLLSDAELGILAEHFLGDAPPAHLPRETVIETLKGQKQIQDWAMSIKSRVAQSAADGMTNATRKAVDVAREGYQQKMQTDPRLAMVTEKFGEWLRESNYNAAQLTAMADANQDGMVSNEEILNLIRTMSNAEPPSWVVDLVSRHIDADGNGQITLPEWWAFLESIGFENAAPALPEPVVQEPVMPEPVMPEPVIAKPTPVEPLPVATPQVVSEPTSHIQEAVPVVAAATAVAATTVSMTPKPVAQEVAPTPAPVPQPAPMADMSGHQGIIEALTGARLLSEFNEIVAKSTTQTCTVKVEKIERSLMAAGEYRGGQTITGVIDGSEHVVTMRFPTSETDFIEGLKKGQVVTAEGSIYRWSGALKQANLECMNARL